LLEKYCKDIFPKSETRFDYVQKVTKTIEKVQKIKKEKNHNLKPENIIEN